MVLSIESHGMIDDLGKESVGWVADLHALIVAKSADCRSTRQHLTEAEAKIVITAECRVRLHSEVSAV